MVPRFGAAPFLQRAIRATLGLAAVAHAGKISRLTMVACMLRHPDETQGDDGYTIQVHGFSVASCLGV